jgi:hypothetical protein
MVEKAALIIIAFSRESINPSRNGKRAVIKGLAEVLTDCQGTIKTTISKARE